LRQQAAVIREGRVYHDFKKSKHSQPHLESKVLDKQFKSIEGFSNAEILVSPIAKFRLLKEDLTALYKMIGKYIQELSEAVSNCRFSFAPACVSFGAVFRLTQRRLAVLWLSQRVQRWMECCRSSLSFTP
jgi:hypothetical protein